MTTREALGMRYQWSGRGSISQNKEADPTLHHREVIRM
jgi:hypothetical protein